MLLYVQHYSSLGMCRTVKINCPVEAEYNSNEINLEMSSIIIFKKIINTLLCSNMEKWITFQNQPWWIWCFLGPISLSLVFGLYCHSIWNTHFPVIHVFSCHLLSSGIFLRALLVSSFMFLAYGSFIWILRVTEKPEKPCLRYPYGFLFLC